MRADQAAKMVVDAPSQGQKRKGEWADTRPVALQPVVRPVVRKGLQGVSVNRLPFFVVPPEMAE